MTNATTNAELADELEGRAAELEEFVASRPGMPAPTFAATLRQSAAALRGDGKLRELADELDRRAASCCELKVRAYANEANRLMGKESAYLHAAELARSALNGETT